MSFSVTLKFISNDFLSYCKIVHNLTPYDICWENGAAIGLPEVQRCWFIKSVSISQSLKKRNGDFVLKGYINIHIMLIIKKVYNTNTL